MHLIAKILTIALILNSINRSFSLDGPELFDKSMKTEKLVIKNQIGFHSKKIVREVSQELFVSRRIDVSAMISAIQVLKQTKEGVERFCKGLTSSEMSASTSRVMTTYFTYIREPAFASFIEAKSRCAAQNMQLPEIYTSNQQDLLSMFLMKYNISMCFAGIAPDTIDVIQRFIATGFPIWHTPHERVYPTNKKVQEHPLSELLDDFHIKFAYAQDGKLMYSHDEPSITYSYVDETFKPHQYRDKHKEMSQLLLPIVCEQKWDGTTNTKVKNNDEKPLPDFNVKIRYSRSVSSTLTNRIETSREIALDDLLGIRGLKEVCFSIASQAGEVQNEMTSKMTALLSLVDISVQLELNSKVRLRGTRSDSHNVEKRSIFLAKFIFSTGIRLIWGLLGFMDRMRMSNRIKRLETALSDTQRQTDLNTNEISNMSKLISTNSIAINELKVTTVELDRRVTEVERRVTRIERTLSDVVNKLEASLALSLIANLIIRIQQSMNSGYDILKDIIHSSLLGQTSPLLLPVDQIEKVQNEVQKVSYGKLDTDFAKMQSIIVSDPDDSRMLLVVINVAALSNKNVELVKLIPIPYYEGVKTFVPAIDHDTIILDRFARTYSILSEQEEHDCLFNRCYVSDVERAISDKKCGIPQLFNLHLEICVSEEILSNGMFIKPMLPDGVLFSFQGEVEADLFCKDNLRVGPSKKLYGIGIFQLPNGCILSVTDSNHRNTKVKGPPLYRMLEADDLTIAMNGPLSELQAINSKNGTQKLTTYGGFLNDHLTSVVQQVQTVDTKISNHSTYIWTLIGVVTAIIIAIMIACILLYKFSRRFYLKIHDIRFAAAGLLQRILDVESIHREVRRNTPPPVAPRPNADFLERFRTRALRVPVPSMAASAASSPPTYISMSAELNNAEECPLTGFQPVSRSIPNLARLYPRATPLLDDLRRETRLHAESQEVEELCKVTSSATRESKLI
jgi:hypothetical protein